MNGGKVVEEGSHDELVNLSGVYRRLVEAQGLKKQIGGTPASDVDVIPSKPQTLQEKNDDFEKDLELELCPQDDEPCDVSELKEKGDERKRQSIFRLIPRLGGVVKDQWFKYVVGIVASISTKNYPSYQHALHLTHLILFF
jgi:ATP-binding cassette subfamily B (MDR/TAP) protein 1